MRQGAAGNSVMAQNLLRRVLSGLYGNTGDPMGAQPPYPAHGLTARVEERINAKIPSY
jgi:hypothetical protein